MSTISTLIAQARAFVTTLRSSIWAIDVRDGIGDSIQKLSEAIEQCYSDVSNPTLQTEALEAALQNKIDEGEMAALTIGDHTITAVKLAQGVIDNTLATSGAAADAKKTGDEIAAVKADLDADDIIVDRLNGAKNLIGRKQILLYNITNTEIASLYDSQLMPGHSYRLKLSKTTWEYTTPPSGTTLLSITAILVGDDYSDVASLIYRANVGDTVDSEITFETPDNFKYLTFQVRCSKTEKIMITVDDLGSVHPDSGLSYNAKKALIDCFKNVYWQNEDGKKYYKKLMKELNYYEYIYNLESPLSVNGTDGYLVTDAKPLSKAAPFTLLIDYTEGGRDWTVSEKVVDTILQIADLDNASSKIIVNTFKTANAAYVTTRVKLYNVEYSVRESKDDCGSRRIKIGISYDNDTDLVICAIAINGTVIEPYTDQTASEVGFSPAQQNLVIGCSARLAEPLKGIINELSFIAQKFDIDELTEYVTN